jgi:hypothetical protein
MLILMLWVCAIRSHTKQNNVTTSAVSKRGNLQFHCFEVIVNSLNWRQVDVYVFILLPTLQTFVIFETCSDLFFKKKKKKADCKLWWLDKPPIVDRLSFVVLVECYAQSLPHIIAQLFVGDTHNTRKTVGFQ